MQASNIFEFLCNFNFKSSNPTTHLITPDHHPRLIYWINLFAILRKRGMCSIVFHRVIILPQHLCIVQHLSELRKFVSRITVLWYSRTCLRKYFCQTRMDNVMAGSAWLKLFVEFLVLFEYSSWRLVVAEIHD